MRVDVLADAILPVVSRALVAESGTAILVILAQIIAILVAGRGCVNHGRVSQRFGLADAVLKMCESIAILRATIWVRHALVVPKILAGGR